MFDTIIVSELIIYIILLLVLLYFFIQYRMKYPLLPQENSEENDIDWTAVKTGDMLFLHYESIHAKLIKVFARSDWSHAALIYRKNDHDIYVIEMSNYKDIDMKGLCVVPLKQWLHLNSDRLCCYAEYVNSKPIDTNVIEELLEKYRKIELDMNLGNWLQSIVKIKHKGLNLKEKYFCSEFAATMLQELDLLDQTWVARSYTPLDLLNLPMFGNRKITML
jgi:hypothetical protein